MSERDLIVWSVWGWFVGMRHAWNSNPGLGRFALREFCYYAGYKTCGGA